ncbi:MAG: hypothetical protein MUO73_09745 [Thermoplasmata archaeon]|nr:hypothetical protein [Thermoplasmata archaeon]
MKIRELEKREKKKSATWSDDEIDTMNRYYTKVKAKELKPYLKNKTELQIHQKAIKLGLTRKLSK